jgi:hypothetical protein
LSDAQEQLAHGDDFGARQTLNKAKALLFDDTFVMKLS